MLLVRFMAAVSVAVTWVVVVDSMEEAWAEVALAEVALAAVAADSVAADSVVVGLAEAVA